MSEKNTQDAKSDPKAKDQASGSAPQETPGTPPEAAIEVAKPGPPVKTPAEWAAKRGLIHKADPRLPQQTTAPHWTHAAADKLFGWSDHAYHYQAKDDAFLIPEEDYVAALDTAAKFPAVAPHAPALPESQRKRFEGFVPRASRKESV